MKHGFGAALLATVLGLSALPVQAQEIVFNELLIRRSGADPHADQIVELRNAGTLSVNIGGWVFCHQFDYTSGLPPDLTLAPGALLTVHFKASGTNSATDVYLPGDELADISDLALYVNGSAFTNPDNMRAFVQYGGVPASGRQSVANQAQLWTLNAFVPSPPTDHSIELCADDPTVVTSYVPQSTPTIGLVNGCGVPTQEVSWGSVKAIFFR